MSQYNGNISQQLWTHSGIAPQHYTYEYDDLNRLTKGAMLNDIGREALTYDKMGNILTLKRTGTASEELDILGYTYQGNRLTQVMDTKSNHTAANYHLPGATNYAYDANGNMKSRTNTPHSGNDITAISYNHLSLPAVIHRTASDSITYAYDATGRKLRTTNQEPLPITSTASNGRIIRSTCCIWRKGVFPRAGLPIPTSTS